MENINLLDPDIRIDYRQHPAFATLPQSGIAESTEQTIYSLFKEVDDVTSLLAQSKEALDNKILNNVTDRILSPIFSEIHKVTMESIPDSCRLKAIVPNIIKQTFETLLEDIHFNNGSKVAEVPVINAPTTRQVYEDLKNKGISVKKLPHEYIQTLWNLTAPQRQQSLEARNTTNKYKVSSNPIPLESQCWDITHQILKAIGYMDGLNMYYGYNMVPMYCTLVHSYPGEGWYRDCYEDVGLKTGQCTYMHYDHSDLIPKALLYLSDVGLDNGPFSVVPGSNGWHKSNVQGIIFKYLDMNTANLVRSEGNYTSDYHRPLFKTKEYRSEFLKLPRAFQGSSHFGDDIIDNTKLSEFLLARELRLTSDIGNCFLFSGHTTIHRGGIVNKGERWVFQMAFKKS